MSACLLVDSYKLRRWQYAALETAITRGLSIDSVLFCNNVYRPRRQIKHAGYYGIRITAMRHRWNSRLSWRPLVEPGAPIVHFDALGTGPWQSIPPDLTRRIMGRDTAVVIKFGMGLLRDPDAFAVTHGVVSFHHGDPSAYRGRPAGFYELLQGADHVGVIVQRISNKLDAGIVLAYASGKLFPYSYRQTLEGAYRNSAYLLTKALENAARGKTVDIATSGKNFRLPDNRTVARFLARMAKEKLRRGVYGAFFEKRWRVAYASHLSLTRVSDEVRLRIRREVPVPRGYASLADPAVIDDDHLLCEGIDKRTGVGHLLSLRGGDITCLDTELVGDGHLSYPHVVRDGPNLYLLPEMSRIGGQILATMGKDNCVQHVAPLVGLEDRRLVDPTLLCHGGRWWLFAGTPTSAAEVLFLWTSLELTGPYAEHPTSPVVMDVSRARCAGPIHMHDGKLFRVGQDSRERYGDGVTVSIITRLTVQDYDEEPRLKIKLEKGHGPHTITVRNEHCVVDVYDDVFSAVAWMPRLRSHLRRRAKR